MTSIRLCAFRRAQRAMRGTYILVLALVAALPAPTFADTSDSLGATGPFYLPLPAPSFDTTTTRFVLNGQVYEIPRNYVVTSENLPDGTLANVSLRALLPALTPLSAETAHCFQDIKDPCHAEVMTIGIDHDALRADGAGRREETRQISHPDKRTGPCGFEYYESFGSEQQGTVVFDFFFTRFAVDRDVSLLRCPTAASPGAPRCNADDNIGNGNAVYYIFPRARLCEWGDIKQKVVNLLRSFQAPDHASQ